MAEAQVDSMRKKGFGARGHPAAASIQLMPPFVRKSAGFIRLNVLA